MGKDQGRYTPAILARALDLKKQGWAWWEVAAALEQEFKIKTSPNAIRCKLKDAGLWPPAAPALPEKIEQHKVKTELTQHKSENKALLDIIAAKDKLIEAAAKISETQQEYTFRPGPTKKLSATQVVLWSDWHVEEVVKAPGLNYLNEFNEKIADARIQRCVESTARLMEITAKESPVDRAILWLGGDFISGNIHEELLENTWATPIEAILWVKRRLIAGIKHLLKRTKVPLVVVCSCGNHGRITKQTHVSTEQGNSLEYFMYHAMRDELQDPQLTWIIAEGYHTYVNLYDKTLRFHHGHGVKYGGGVGGIFIPAYKAIAQWNKGKHADLDCFGHFHQLKNGGNFIVNGSLIGYNSYAVQIKADFGRPYQKFFMFASTGEVIAEYPVFLEE